MFPSPVVKGIFETVIPVPPSLYTLYSLGQEEGRESFRWGKARNNSEVA
jgi:hypothetical protein